jgi:hypothetical protein
MKAAALPIMLCIWAYALQEPGSLEKQAFNLVQRTQASDIDPALPNVNLKEWFTQLVGPRAGINWQLSECGEPITGPDKEPDLPACIGANAMLQDRAEDVPPPPPPQIQNSERPQLPQRLGDAILDGIAPLQSKSGLPTDCQDDGCFRDGQSTGNHLGIGTRYRGQGRQGPPVTPLRSDRSCS